MIKPLIKPGDYGGVRVLTTYPFPDSCKVSKLFGQAFAIEFVWKSIARRHQRPRELPVTRMTDLKRRVFHTIRFSFHYLHHLGFSHALEGVRSLSNSFLLLILW